MRIIANTKETVVSTAASDIDADEEKRITNKVAAKERLQERLKQNDIIIA